MPSDLAANPAITPGWQTSEFWRGVLIDVLTGVVTLLYVTGNTAPGTESIVWALVAASGINNVSYGRDRRLLKTAADSNAADPAHEPTPPKRPPSTPTPDRRPSLLD